MPFLYTTLCYLNVKLNLIFGIKSLSDRTMYLFLRQLLQSMHILTTLQSVHEG